MPKLKSLFAAITKVDASKRTVTGIAMQEVVDRTNEKCLYEESKPFFAAWSDGQSKASGGKSKGNLRAMHGNKVAGRVIELVNDDELKAFVVTAEIVADDEWKLVESGSYTGFSIGANFARDAQGKAMKKMVDGVLEWVADPVELSIVDTPCVPTALFELKAADGSSRMHKFASASQRKSMYSVSQMSSALANVAYMMQDLEWEKDIEGDDSQIPARLRSWIESGAEIFLDLAEEETSEFAQMITAQKAARADRVKAGGCSCDCASCSNCKKKAAMPAGEKKMNPEQQKAFDAGMETLKSLAPAIEALKSVPESLKTITAKQDAMEAAQTKRDGELDTRLKAVEEIGESMQAFVEAFGEQPETPKTKSAIAVERAADKGTGAANEGGAAADLPKDGEDLTNKKGSRLDAFKNIHAGGGEPSVMSSARG
jgi:hypothetical protein